MTLGQWLLMQNIAESAKSEAGAGGGAGGGGPQAQVQYGSSAWQPGQPTGWLGTYPGTNIPVSQPGVTSPIGTGPIGNEPAIDPNIEPTPIPYQGGFPTGDPAGFAPPPAFMRPGPLYQYDPGTFDPRVGATPAPSGPQVFTPTDTSGGGFTPPTDPAMTTAIDPNSIFSGSGSTDYPPPPDTSQPINYPDGHGGYAPINLGNLPVSNLSNRPPSNFNLGGFGQPSSYFGNPIYQGNLLNTGVPQPGSYSTLSNPFGSWNQIGTGATPNYQPIYSGQDVSAAYGEGPDPDRPHHNPLFPGYSADVPAGGGSGAKSA